MATGGTILVWMFWLWSCLLLEPGMSQEEEEEEEEEEEDEKLDNTLVSAPPELLALLPKVAKATVAAGYTNSTSEDVITMPLHQIESPPLTVSFSEEPEVTTKKRTMLIKGDNRYTWQDWSEWHCNCEEGSMSRVRDIAYSVPNVHLDPVQYDILRFERQACSYSVCDCSPEEHECDRRAVTCEAGPMHLCALKDIEKDQDQKRKDFWGRVYRELKSLWQSLNATFPLP